MNVAPRGAGTRKGHTASLALAVRRRPLLSCLSQPGGRTGGWHVGALSIHTPHVHANGVLSIDPWCRSLSPLPTYGRCRRCTCDTHRVFS